MNKIFNWTFGSVFRTFGRILAYLLFGVLIGVLMHKNNIKIIDLLGIDTIHASTITIGTPQGWAGYYYQCDSSSCPSSPSNTGLTNFGTSANVYTNSNYFHFVRYSAQVFSYNFNSNNSYSVNFRIHLGGYSTGLNFLKDNQAYKRWTYETTGFVDSTNGYKDDYIKASSCSIRYDSDTNNGFLVSCGFSLNQNVSRVRILIDFTKGYQDTIPGNKLMQFTSMRVNLISSQEYQGDQALFEQQTNQLIDNANTNTSKMMENQDKNTQNIINSSLVCKKVDITSATLNGYLSVTGQFIEQTGYNKSTDFINLNGSIITLLEPSTSNKRVCFYKSNKDYISCKEMNSYNSGDIIPVPADATYYRLTFDVQEELPIYKICSNGNQATNDSINDLNNSINDDDTSGATSSAGSFFSNFTTNTHGLTGIITAPLTAINRLASSSCSPLVLPLPYVNQNLTLPCMRPIYDDNFGAFMDIYDVVVLGIITYWILVRIFALVKDFKNPEHDEIEVMDL